MRHCALTKQDAMKACWGAEVQLHAFLTSTLDRGEWSASHLGRFTPRERDNNDNNNNNNNNNNNMLQQITANSRIRCIKKVLV